VGRRGQINRGRCSGSWPEDKRERKICVWGEGESYLTKTIKERKGKYITLQSRG